MHWKLFKGKEKLQWRKVIRICDEKDLIPTHNIWSGWCQDNVTGIRPYTEEFLSHSQSGFRPERGTADVAWAHTRLATKTKKEDVEIKITGIDMSAAFDTIDRKTLLDMLEHMIQEDELRIIMLFPE
ncbi:very-long-chain enoyl-CoA reductase [Elysia marginata]|uniref:Very-long-chain enoyl-CoA reductase n=1 Tax=Elysia marginata TaxID=1093978 RepID=A0AAV4FFG0_9GAST|nr:very-long-chain enoyl-CoA reductase [Elysia marginata]